MFDSLEALCLRALCSLSRFPAIVHLLLSRPGCKLATQDLRLKFLQQCPQGNAMSVPVVGLFLCPISSSHCREGLRETRLLLESPG